MTKKSNLYKLPIAVGVVVFISTLISCASTIPVQEMDAARKEIDAATAENAQKHAPDSYNKSREALLKAHKALADDELSDAKSTAIESKAVAMQARSVSAPQNMESKSQLAKTGIEDADTVYAEALAPRDFAAAKELYEDGQRLATAARGGDVEGASTEQTEKSLYNYSEAARKFDASNEAANKAKNLSLSQKEDILDSLGGVRSKLEKAELYGAEQQDPDAIASAKSKLDESESLIEDDKIKAGYMKMKEAENETNEILAAVEGKYAESKLAQAKASVQKSETRYAGINTKANQSSMEKKAVLATLGEQVGAAKEALESSDSFYKEEKFSDSINESEEAIRLSQIITEQSDLLANASSRNVSTTEDSSTISGDSKAYKVGKHKPAESLWRIAKDKKNYGNGFLWKRIYEANKQKIKNPNLIYPGQVLVIPPKKGAITEVKEEPTDSKENLDKIVDDKKEEIKNEIEDKVNDEIDEEMERTEENEE